MILVDSNVLIDIVGNDPTWRRWAIEQISALGGREALRFNLIVVAEVAPRLGDLELFYAEMAALDIFLEELTDEAAFLAGCAFQHYRRNRGQARSVLPDFLIGGHAKAIGASILTRDRRFYDAYFAGVPLITPTKDDE